MFHSSRSDLSTTSITKSRIQLEGTPIQGTDIDSDVEPIQTHRLLPETSACLANRALS